MDSIKLLSTRVCFASARAFTGLWFIVLRVGKVDKDLHSLYVVDQSCEGTADFPYGPSELHQESCYLDAAQPQRQMPSPFKYRHPENPTTKKTTRRSTSAGAAIIGSSMSHLDALAPRHVWQPTKLWKKKRST